jgi:hypothetical protein
LISLTAAAVQEVSMNRCLEIGLWQLWLSNGITVYASVRFFIDPHQECLTKLADFN